MMKTTTIIKGLAATALAAGVLLMASTFWRPGSISTDDAQIEQYISPINVKVPGYIKEIRFTEHQKVRRGDTLLVIDDREYRIAVKQAEAGLMDARSGREVVGITRHTAMSGAGVLDASIDEALLKVEKLQHDYDRYCRLLQRKATTPAVVEQYRTELDMARARVEALRHQRQAADYTVSETGQRRENADAAVLRAEAALDMAMLNLGYTVITAPCDGVLGRRNIEAGQLVSPGQTITTIVPDGRKWIVANFRETDIARLGRGQKVSINVDALPDTTFTGTVTAVSAATGSKYSMIPTDNSSGNFVKIQQRVPVRIDFSQEVTDASMRRLATGMMCTVRVQVKNGEDD